MSLRATEALLLIGCWHCRAISLSIDHLVSLVMMLMILVTQRDVILAVHQPLKLLAHRVNRVVVVPLLSNKVARVNPKLTVLLLVPGWPLLAVRGCVLVGGHTIDLAVTVGVSLVAQVDALVSITAIGVLMVNDDAVRYGGTLVFVIFNSDQLATLILGSTPLLRVTTGRVLTLTRWDSRVSSSPSTSVVRGTVGLRAQLCRLAPMTDRLSSVVFR